MPESIDEYWDNYNKIYSFEEVLKKFRSRKIIEVLDRYAPKRILEIGCGYEPNFQNYTDFASYVAVEPGTAAFDYAAQLGAGDARVEIRNGLLEDVADQLVGVDFDCIILPGLLHEVADPTGFLQLVRAIGGSEVMVYINVPNANSVHRIVGMEMGLIENTSQLTERNIFLEQQRVYSSGSLEIELRKVWPELEILDSGTFFLKPFTHAQMHGMTAKGLLDDGVFDALYKATDVLTDYGSELFVVAKAPACP